MAKLKEYYSIEKWQIVIKLWIRGVFAAFASSKAAALQTAFERSPRASAYRNSLLQPLLSIYPTSTSPQHGCSLHLSIFPLVFLLVGVPVITSGSHYPPQHTSFNSTDKICCSFCHVPCFSAICSHWSCYNFQILLCYGFL